MSQQHRKKVVHKFKKSTKSMVLLASLKAGGVGVRLPFPCLIMPSFTHFDFTQLNLVRIALQLEDRWSLFTHCYVQVVATHVYLMDAWWNSSIESQAVRSHS